MSDTHSQSHPKSQRELKRKLSKAFTPGLVGRDQPRTRGDASAIPPIPSHGYLMPPTSSSASHADRKTNCSYGASVELFSNASDIKIDNSPILVNVMGEDRPRILEARLMPSKKANHRHHLEGENLRRTTCTDGTRVRILNEIMSWAAGIALAEAALYWLFGAAGSGKSTIAYTIANQLDKMAGPYSKIALGGTFFCSRQFPETRRASCIIPSIVYRLALECGAFADALNRYGNFDTVDRDIPSQLEGLLITPWLESETVRLADPSLPQCYVLVIDALDEIDGKGGSEFLGVLLHAIEEQRLPGLKFFATSRHDPVLVDKVESFPDRRFYRLEQAPFDEAQNDITTYLTRNLADIRHEVIEKLVTLAAGLFIYAATILKYLEGYESLEQEELLDGLLSTSPSEFPPRSSDETSLLDELYHRILDDAFRGLEKTMRERRLQILHTFLCTPERTSAFIVAQLLNTSNKPDSYLKIVNNVFDRLHAVLYSDGGKILFYHKSFPDFIFAQARSNQFWCNEMTHHQELAKSCFRIMRAGLRFNIANIPSSFILDYENDTLAEEVERNISPILRYSCRHWSHHLRISTVSESIYGTLSDFLRLRVLFWIEAMNLLKLHGLCNLMLRTAGEWASKRHNLKLANGFTKAASFAVYFSGNHTSQSTPHLYVSALATWPLDFDEWRDHFPGIPHFTRASQQENTLQLLTLRVGDRVNSVAMSNDCNFIVCGSEDHSVRVWDASTGEQLKVLKRHTDDVTSVAFSTDGMFIVSGSRDRSVRVWNALTGEQLIELVGHTDWLNSVAFSNDGKRIVSGSDDSSVLVWDVSTGKQLKVLEGHAHWVTSVAFSRDGNYIVSGSRDRSVRMWDASTGEQLRKLEGHADDVTSVAFSSDGKCIVSGSRRSVRVWDTSTGEQLKELKGHTDLISSVAFSTDGTRIVSCSWDASVRVWDALTGEQLQELKGHTDYVTSVAFSSDDSRIISGSRDLTVRVWDAAMGEQLKELEGHTNSVTSAFAFSADGNRNISAWDASRRVWNLPIGEQSEVLKGQLQPVTSVAFSNDGNHIISGSRDGSVRVWGASTGEHLIELEGHTDLLPSIAFSPDGNYVVSGTQDRSVWVWDVPPGDQFKLLEGHTDFVTSVAFSTDGNHIVSGSRDRSVRMWDASTGEQLMVLRGHTNWVTSVAFSSDGNHIVSGSWDVSVRVWDVSTGEQLKMLPVEGHTELVTAVIFSTDGNHIISASRDGSVRVWDVSTGEQLMVFRGHTHWVTSVACSPDGNHIVSGSRDRSVRMWDTSTGEQLKVLDGHTHWVTSVAFSANGNRIVSGSWDRSVRVWDVSKGAQLESVPVEGNSDHVAAWDPKTGHYIRDAIHAHNGDVQYTGWLVSPVNQHRLMFVPPDALLPDFYNILTMPSSASSSVNFTHAMLGPQWHNCYRP